MKSVRLISFTCGLLILDMNNNSNFMRIYLYILNIYPFGDRQTVGEPHNGFTSVCKAKELYRKTFDFSSTKEK